MFVCLCTTIVWRRTGGSTGDLVGAWEPLTWGVGEGVGEGERGWLRVCCVLRVV